MIPTSGIPATSYTWILAPSGWVTGCVFKTPLVNVSWPTPTTYSTISSSIRASPLSTVIPPKLVNGAVFAIDTTVPSAVNSEVVWTIVVSGSTSIISTLFVAPWWAWFGCVTSKTLPVNKSLVTIESPFTVTDVIVFVT